MKSEIFVCILRHVILGNAHKNHAINFIKMIAAFITVALFFAPNWADPQIL
jgi:hypothetical protein